jgi:hypothetical protein
MGPRADRVTATLQPPRGVVAPNDRTLLRQLNLKAPSIALRQFDSLAFAICVLFYVAIHVDAVIAEGISPIKLLMHAERQP